MGNPKSQGPSSEGKSKSQLKFKIREPACGGRFWIWKFEVCLEFGLLGFGASPVKGVALRRRR